MGRHNLHSFDSTTSTGFLLVGFMLIVKLIAWFVQLYLFLIDTMLLTILFSLSKISFFIFKCVICCIIFRSSKINCLYDLRESRVLGTRSFSPNGTVTRFAYFFLSS